MKTSGKTLQTDISLVAEGLEIEEAPSLLVFFSFLQKARAGVQITSLRPVLHVLYTVAKQQKAKEGENED